jgi:dimethylglycine dehydrogenase
MREPTSRTTSAKSAWAGSSGLRAGAPARFADGVPSWFGKSLFDGDLERLVPHVEGAQRRVPALANCGIKDIVNGPISYTPDGSRADRAGLGAAERLAQRRATASASRRQAGRAGSSRNGSSRASRASTCSRSIPRASAPTPSKRYVVTKNEETYRNVFTVHYPDEERPDARPAKTSPVYEKLKRMGAVFGQRYGWERANWFAPAASRRRTTGASAARTGSSTSATSAVGCANGRRHRPDALHQALVRGPAPRPGSTARREQGAAKVGRMALSHALTKRGGIRSEFTITKLGEELFYVVSAGAAERYDTDLLAKRLPRTARCAPNITTARGCFVLAGPRSRDVLAKLTDTPLDNDGFPWLTGQETEVGLATDVYLLRVNFVGSLGWELHFPIEYANHLFEAIFAAGEEYRHRHGGMRAMESLRMEKSYRMWGSDLTRENTPLRGEPRPLRAHEKGDFTGARRSSASSRRRTEPLRDARRARREGCRSARQRAAVRRKGQMIGRATSGYYGHVLKKSLAIGYVKPEFAEVGTKIAIEILGERKDATVLVDSPYDPENKDLRA